MKHSQSLRNGKSLLKHKLGRKFRKSRTGNGMEFCGEEFNKFCRENGIERHFTVRMTPQQNGLAERLNRTIMERVRCMMSCANLSKNFWAEAVATAVYVINRSPSTTIDLKTPMEKWSGHAPTLCHLKVFGSVAYAHINKGKLEPRAIKCMFLGYPEE